VGQGLLIHEVSISQYHTRHITVGRTPLDEWIALRRDLYLTTHNTHNRQTSRLPLGFETTISAGEWPQTYALDCAATATGPNVIRLIKSRRMRSVTHVENEKCMQIANHNSLEK